MNGEAVRPAVGVGRPSTLTLAAKGGSEVVAVIAGRRASPHGRWWWNVINVGPPSLSLNNRRKT
jgi:hypothetical protein